MTNILVIKLRYIGDVLLATPVLRALRERFPDAHLAMAVLRGTEDVLKGNPDLTEVVVVERGGLATQFRFLQSIRRRRFDCVIDLTDGDRSAILSWFSGAPVVTSDRTALPEVAGDAALLVNPDDDEALAGAMVRVLRDASLRESLRTKGFERARQFTWERAARQTLDVYRELCQ